MATKKQVQTAIEKKGYVVKWKNQYAVSAYKDGKFIVTVGSDNLKHMPSPIENLAKYLNVSY